MPILRTNTISFYKFEILRINEMHIFCFIPIKVEIYFWLLCQGILALLIIEIGTIVTFLEDVNYSFGFLLILLAQVSLSKVFMLLMVLLQALIDSFISFTLQVTTLNLERIFIMCK